MITENLSTLKIHKISKEQYDRELSAGNIDPIAIYLTEDEGEVDTSSIVEAVKESLTTESWVFTLVDGTTTTKNVLLS